MFPHSGYNTYINHVHRELGLYLKLPCVRGRPLFLFFLIYEYIWTYLSKKVFNTYVMLASLFNKFKLMYISTELYNSHAVLTTFFYIRNVVFTHYNTRKKDLLSHHQHPMSSWLWQTIFVVLKDIFFCCITPPSPTISLIRVFQARWHEGELVQQYFFTLLKFLIICTCMSLIP